MAPCRRRPFALAVVLAAVLTTAAWCAPGHARAAVPTAEAPDPGFIQGSDGGEDDQLAAAVLVELQNFWTSTFPTISGGRAFEPLAGFYSIDSSRPGGAVPCLRSSQEIKGNAFYCPQTDILGFDRAALLPGLREQFGDAAAMVVLAHEFGHALQARLAGSSDPAASTEMPTILAEGQADCYAGVFLRRVRDGGTPNLRTDARGTDQALAALGTFRDPVGTAAADAQAHGNAFDRVSSFQQGFDGNAETCAAMTTRNREFTQTGFASLRDESNGGNLTLTELLAAMGPDLERFFGQVVRERSGTWTAPAVQSGTATCPGEAAGTSAEGQAAGAQGPVAFCSSDAGAASVRVDEGGELAELHRSIGDYASGTLLASRYSMAAAAALGLPTDDPDAGRRALCLTGAYTGAAAAGDDGGEFGLSPGDLDEAVQILLRSDRPAAGTSGASELGTGYERARVFRQGVDAGPDACLGRAR